MRKLALLTFVTLDGVMQAPGHAQEDRSGGFEFGGWATPYWDEVMKQVMNEAMAEPYDLLLGYNTYKSFASHWPHANDPVAQKLNSFKKHVVTSTTDTLDWENSVKISGGIAENVTQLKAEDGNSLQVHGSWELIQLLLSKNLIDEFRIWIFPVFVGSGKKLFSSSTIPTDLKLVKTDSTSNGVIMSIYRMLAANV